MYQTHPTQIAPMSLVPRSQQSAQPLPTSRVGVVDMGLAASVPAEQSFVLIYEALFARLVSFATRFLPADEAADVVQDTFSDIWTRWDVLSIERPDVPYFFRAVRNQIANHRRGTHREFKRLGFYLTQLGRRTRRESEADAKLERDELAAVIEATVEGLSDRCREVWTLVRDNQFTYKQAAEAMGIAEETSKRHMTIAQRVLREAVTDAGYREAARAAGKQLPRQSQRSQEPTND